MLAPALLHPSLRFATCSRLGPVLFGLPVLLLHAIAPQTSQAIRPSKSVHCFALKFERDVALCMHTCKRSVSFASRDIGRCGAAASATFCKMLKQLEQSRA